MRPSPRRGLRQVSNKFHAFHSWARGLANSRGQIWHSKMATRALKSVIPNGPQYQQSSTNASMGSAPLDPFSNQPFLPPDHRAVGPHLREDSGNRSNTRSSPRKSRDVAHDENKPLAEGTRTKRSASFKSLLGKDTVKSPKKKSEKQEGKSLKKSKSSTSLSALLSRPRSSKGSKSKEESIQKDKENETPPGAADLAPPPIWAQFATQATPDVSNTTKIPLNDCRSKDEEMALYTPSNYSPSKQRNFHDSQRPTLSGRAGSRPRPKSECLGSGPSSTSLSETLSGLRRSARDKVQSKPRKEEPATQSDNRDSHTYRPTSQKSNSGLTENTRGSRVMTAVAAFNGKAKELPKEPAEKPSAKPDPQVIESAFEELLVREKVPT